MLVRLFSNPGGSGISSGAAWLQTGQGSPAPPQPQAFGPSQGRSGWFSQTQWVSSQWEHATSGPPLMRRGLLLDLLAVQMGEHIAEVAHVQQLAADRAADEVVTLTLRRRPFRLAFSERDAAPFSGSASRTSKRLVALAAMKSCREAETSSSRSTARCASASATSDVASGAVAVVLDLVEPALPGRNPLDHLGEERLDEAGIRRFHPNRAGLLTLRRH